MKLRIVKVLALIIIGGIGILVGNLIEKLMDRENIPPSIDEINPIEFDPMHRLEMNIAELPDSNIKNSMTIVIASEYAGVGSELNDMLRTYAKMQVQSLRKQNQL
jgi:hypothetical protein